MSGDISDLCIKIKHLILNFDYSLSKLQGFSKLVIMPVIKVFYIPFVLRRLCLHMVFSYYRVQYYSAVILQLRFTNLAVTSFIDCGAVFL